MLRSLLAAALLFASLTSATAQTTPRRKAGRARTPYSVRSPRRVVQPGISPRTGRPYGEALQQHPELREQIYLAPGVPVRKRSTYLPKSSYSSRTPRPATKGSAGGTTLGSSSRQATPARRP